MLRLQWWISVSACGLIFNKKDYFSITACGLKKYYYFCTLK